MKRFLAENWLWIVVPFVLVLGAILAFIWWGQSDDIAGFVYPV